MRCGVAPPGGSHPVGLAPALAQQPTRNRNLLAEAIEVEP
jgi:hypothetical protein